MAVTDSLPYTPQEQSCLYSFRFALGFAWLLPTHSPAGLWYQCLEHGVKLLWALLHFKMASLKLQQTHSRTSTLSPSEAEPTSLPALFPSTFFPPTSSSSWFFIQSPLS